MSGVLSETTHDDLRFAVETPSGGGDRRGVLPCLLTIYATRFQNVRDADFCGCGTGAVLGESRLEEHLMLKAYDVLHDCRVALELLESETRPDVFRVLWVAGVSLARAVGHVLHKVDAERDDATKRVVGIAYQSWQVNRSENAIFWDFIEEERNQVLKQYEIGFLAGPVDVVVGAETFTLDDHLFCPVTDGPYAGEDCRDLLAEAIEWWSTQLAQIEESILGEGA
jgi:hypothetical protein